MSDSDADREARRLARANWPIRKFKLGEEPPDDLSRLSPEERVVLTCELSIRMWLLGGNKMPDVPRSQWPGRVLRSA